MTGLAASGTDPDFATSDGLRALLEHMAAGGPDAWATSQEAANLLAFCATRYEHLARKHHLTPHDAAVAAFEVLRTPAVRRARNPWAMVTTAVARTLRAEARANDLLCSRDRARRLLARTDLPAAWRIGDPSAPTSPTSSEPSPWLESALSTSSTATVFAPEPDPATAAAVHRVRTATRAAVAVLAAVGWPDDVVRLGLDHIIAALTEAGSMSAARQRLRKDRQILAALDLDQRAWSRLLAVTLGSSARTGLLHRLLAGDAPRRIIIEDAHDLTPPRNVNTREVDHAA
ncbi:hypothetical protein [Myceligenerans crystallogenes]